MPRKGPNRRGRLAIVVAAASLLLAGCSNTPAPSDDQPGFVSGDRSITLVAPADRRPAPLVQGTRLGSDASVSSADFAGQVLVLNVWGSWCNPCRAEAKDLQAASQETAGTAQFLGLNTKDYSPAPALAFVRSFGVSYPQIFDPEGRVLVSLAQVLPPNAIPTTLVIDRQNRIAARVAGTVSQITLVSLINDVAAGR
jgi:thiol-disulfide isomerase/thioredoxin